MLPLKMVGVAAASWPSWLDSSCGLCASRYSVVASIAGNPIELLITVPWVAVLSLLFSHIDPRKQHIFLVLRLELTVFSCKVVQAESARQLSTEKHLSSAKLAHDAQVQGHLMAHISGL